MANSPPDTLHLDDYLPYRLSVASNRVSRLIARLYQDRFGLSIWQWRVLAILGAQNELTAGQVAKRAAMDKMAVSRAVSALLARGLIVRETSKHDARARILSLTETGMGIYTEIAPLAREQEQHLLGGFSADDIKFGMQFLQALETRAAALAGEES
ncbi:MAG: MarR family transcriptional regulator [Robiginitomaculum sp.]|nr:MAG: MarR family transcriptional regulator [Robiginitomaculum sp.]